MLWEHYKLQQPHHNSFVDEHMTSAILGKATTSPKKKENVLLVLGIINWQNTQDDMDLLVRYWLSYTYCIIVYLWKRPAVQLGLFTSSADVCIFTHARMSDVIKLIVSNAIHTTHASVCLCLVLTASLLVKSLITADTEAPQVYILAMYKRPIRPVR